MTQEIQKNFTTPVGTLSFPTLFRARSVKGADSKPSYSATILLKKGVPENEEWVKNLKAAIVAIAKEKFGGKIPSELTVPLKDGDTSRFERGQNKGRLRKEVNPEVEGHYIISARKYEGSEYPHKVVDHNLEAIVNENAVYAGCLARMVFGIYAYDKGDCGVGAGLNVVQKVGDGKPLASGGMGDLTRVAPADCPVDKDPFEL